MWMDDDIPRDDQREAGTPESEFLIAEADDYGDLENDFDDFEEDDFDDDFDDDFEEELDDEYEVENEEFPEDDFEEVDPDAIPEEEFEDADIDEEVEPGVPNGEEGGFESEDSEEFTED